MYYYIIGGVVLLVVIYVALEYVRKIKLHKKFTGQYFDWAGENHDFESLNYVRRYWDTKNLFEKIQYKVDDITWNDLDMDHLFFKMNATQSSVGEEYLYAKLRATGFDENVLKEFGAMMDFMDNNRDTKIEALCALHILGKDLYNNVHSYIYKIDEKPIKNIARFYILMVLPLLSIATCFFTLNGLFLVFSTFLINILVYYKNKFMLEINLNSLNYISKMVNCANKLSKLNLGETKYSRQLKASLKPLQSLSRLGNIMAWKFSTDMEVFIEYVKIVFMWDFINYNKMIGVLSKHRQEFHQIYRLIGELDSAIAVSEYRKTLGFYSIPEFGESENVTYDEVYHPLIKKPVSNSMCWDNNVLITGSNASGKSTFIKALAITTICSQSIYLCFARSYKSKMSCVLTSMAVRDKICDGESYFVAEVKSLKRILDSVNNDTRIVCFIDEILKGTNTIERIASSSAVLSWLTGKNCKVMVASHDIELTEILSNIYNNFHFKEQVLNGGLFFDYKLYDGIVKTRNAINLLKFIGYDNKVISLANDLADYFESNKIWDNILLNT